MSSFKRRASHVSLETQYLPPYAETDENLPPYAESGDGGDQVKSFLRGLLWSSDQQEIDTNIVQELISSEYQRISENASKTRNFYAFERFELSYLAICIIRTLFSSIATGDSELISWLLQNRLITADTINTDGMTPLLAAVKAGRMRIVQELVDFGAEPDAYGTVRWQRVLRGETPIKRTPLQFAAELGNLPFVKLFIETYHCDDSKIAPDGELALRLAAENGHRHVVDYLPVRRGGGWKRWQTKHQKAMKNAERAVRSIFFFARIVVWDAPKFLLWTIPNEIIFRPLKSRCVWCWENRKNLLKLVQYQVLQTPIRLQKAARWIWKSVQEIPQAISDGSKAIWQFVTDFLPGWTWRILTKEIPKVIASMSKWIWGVLSSTLRLTIRLAQRIISLIHTAFVAMITFFQNLTLTDIWNGFCDILTIIFVSVPLTIWSWIVSFGEVMYKFMERSFGIAGIVIWYIGYAIVYASVYIPKQLWYIVGSFGKSMAAAFGEVMIWFNPKA
ncbi:hypothetical protein FQN50_002235 [Emmonsiellopsis sp. PD_5]|nr:hypothetical protein FQN50_002235 [Emmonsiellopsis sp. PD_5]